jgi:ABC-type protease/lipase transport system fused ATPase/permease subunit
MNISNHYKEIIVEELKNVATKMKESNDITDKLYFFSAAFAILDRIFNLEFNPTLVLIHMVLQTAYFTISGRVEALIRGQDKVVKIPERFFDSLQETILDIANNISKDDKNELFKNLQKIANLSYVTTGNGYYLFKKGMLKI